MSLARQHVAGDEHVVAVKSDRPEFEPHLCHLVV